jgi:hypothetical protein
VVECVGRRAADFTRESELVLRPDAGTAAHRFAPAPTPGRHGTPNSPTMSATQPARKPSVRRSRHERTRIRVRATTRRDFHRPMDHQRIPHHRRRQHPANRCPTTVNTSRTSHGGGTPPRNLRHASVFRAPHCTTLETVRSLVLASAADQRTVGCVCHATGLATTQRPRATRLLATRGFRPGAIRSQARPRPARRRPKIVEPTL